MVVDIFQYIVSNIVLIVNLPAQAVSEIRAETGAGALLLRG